jgi:hypothetical protein
VRCGLGETQRQRASGSQGLDRHRGVLGVLIKSATVTGTISDRPWRCNAGLASVLWSAVGWRARRITSHGPIAGGPHGGEPGIARKRSRAARWRRPQNCGETDPSKACDDELARPCQGIVKTVSGVQSTPYGAQRNEPESSEQKCSVLPVMAFVDNGPVY